MSADLPEVLVSHLDPTGLQWDGGRYYDPVVGIHLQPNPFGGVPEAPQSLNLYAATSVGRGMPGAGQAAVNGPNHLQGLFNATAQNTIAGLMGLPISRYADNLTVAGRLKIKGYKSVFKRAGYLDVFTDPGGRGKREFVSELVEPLGNLRYRVVNGSQVGTVIDLSQLKTEGRLKLGYPGGTRASAFVDERVLYKPFQRFLGSFPGEFVSGSVAELAVAVPEVFGIWNNPYFNNYQKGIQTSVTVAGAVTSAGVGAYITTIPAVASLGGPVVFVIGVGTGVIVYAGFEYLIKPGVSFIATEVVGTRDPYKEYRDLRPLGGQN
jgi:hypothetical protein